MFGIVLRVLSSFSLSRQACQAVYMIAGSKTKTRNIPLRGVSETVIGQISACATFILSCLSNSCKKQKENPTRLARNPQDKMGHEGLAFAFQRSLRTSSIRFDPAGRPFGTKEGLKDRIILDGDVEMNGLARHRKSVSFLGHLTSFV